MNNLEIANLKKGEFLKIYKSTKAGGKEKKPINSAALSLENQLKRFKASSFTEEETKALHEDALSV